jgi:hypothetical protein
VNLKICTVRIQRRCHVTCIASHGSCFLATQPSADCQDTNQTRQRSKQYFLISTRPTKNICFQVRLKTREKTTMPYLSNTCDPIQYKINNN